MLGAVSYELIRGGLLWNAGLLNVVEIHDERHSLALTQQYLHLDSVRLEYDDHIVDYGRGWSHILDGDAYLPDGITSQAGIAWTFPDGGMISIGFDRQSGGDDWRSYGSQLSLLIPSVSLERKTAASRFGSRGGRSICTGCRDASVQSNRSRFITLCHAATKSCTNCSVASSLA